ncbi:MAG: MFS transporter, partial [Methylophilaceae bacterium]|nr:MFS transporter [Methylophilaceae bacterium]
MINNTQKSAHQSANPLRNLSFFKLLNYRVLMVLSYQIMAVAVGWHLYQITHDPLSLGLIGLAEIIPYFCTALFAGYAVDHYSSRNFGVSSSFTLMLSALLIYAITEGRLSVDPTLWIYGAIALIGLARAFIAPTYSAIFASIMPRQEYAKGASIGSAAFQFGLITGPAIGGILVGWTSLQVAYLVSAGLACASGIALLTLEVQTPKVVAEKAIFSGIA